MSRGLGDVYKRQERDEGTGAAGLWGINKGCSILRVHNVPMAVRMAKVWDALKNCTVI